MGEGVDKAVVGRVGEGVISVSLMVGAAGNWKLESLLTKSMKLGGNPVAKLSLLSGSLPKSLILCSKAGLFSIVGTASFPSKDPSSIDGNDIASSGPKSIFGRGMLVGLCSSLARSLATSCRSLATAPIGAGASFSSMPSLSIVEGESTISVSESEILGGDAEVWKGSS